MEEVKAMSKGELKKRRGMQFNKLSKASNLFTDNDDSSKKMST